MCNGCRHGFECCAFDGFTCGCGTEVSIACLADGECSGCDGVTIDGECPSCGRDPGYPDDLPEDF